MPHLYLIRHAKAGERRLWNGDDVHRPLSKKGWKQSEMLAKRLAELDPSTLLSSPYTRCVQTLEPLATRLGTEVEIDDRLTETEPVEPVLELIAEAPNGTVMCTHGDLVSGALAALGRHGAQLRTPVDWRKATVWVLKRNKKGGIVHATVWPPPVL